MALDTTHTILTIRDADTAAVSLLPLYSAQGLRQSLEPIDATVSQERTINAELVDLSLSRFRKYRSVISARDVRPPSRDDIWPGMIVVVECACLRSYATMGGSPARTPVSGSEFVEGDFTFYRPTFTFMIGKMTGSFDEWEADNDWSIELNEV
jgi:hypothetical protein